MRQLLLADVVPYRVVLLQLDDFAFVNLNHRHASPRRPAVFKVPCCKDQAIVALFHCSILHKIPVQTNLKCKVPSSTQMS